MAMTALDYEQIRQLVARYCYMLDTDDAAGVASCFAPDGVLDVRLAPDAAPIRAHDDDDERLRDIAMAAARIDGHTARRACVSVSVGVGVDGDGDCARVFSYALNPYHYLHGFVALDADGGRYLQRDNSAIGTTGVYVDTVVKHDGRWLFSNRTFRYDGWPDVMALTDRSLRPVMGSAGASSDSTGGADGDLSAAHVDASSQLSATGAGMTEDDFEEIRQLLARCSQSLDFGDADGFAACFTADGVLESTAPEEGLGGSHRGREELRTFVRTAQTYAAGHVRHSAVNSLIEGDGTSARASSYAIVTRDYGPSAVPVHVTYFSVLATTGMFFDEFVRSHDQWLFSRRRFVHDALPDVLERVGKPATIWTGGASGDDERGRRRARDRTTDTQTCDASLDTDDRTTCGMTASDHEAIKQLHARYCHAIDFADLEGFVACFAPDGCFDAGRSVHRGSEALRSFAASIAAKDRGHGRHCVLSSMTDGDGETARSLSVAIITRDYGAPSGKGQATHAAVLGVGVYTDDLVRRDSGWVYLRRAFCFDGLPDRAEVVGEGAA
jgi:ketosteroid isomerase-like protein